MKVFNAGQSVSSCAACILVIGCRQVHTDAGCGCPVICCVNAITAIKRIISCAAVKNVVTITAIKRIVSAFTGKVIRTSISCKSISKFDP